MVTGSATGWPVSITRIRVLSGVPWMAAMRRPSGDQAGNEKAASCGAGTGVASPDDEMIEREPSTASSATVPRVASGRSATIVAVGSGRRLGSDDVIDGPGEAGPTDG